MWGLSEISNITDLKKGWGDRFDFWRQHTSRRQRSYICRGYRWCDVQGRSMADQVVMYRALTAQALAERLIAAGYEPKEE
jgi:hypothetical protein